MTGPRQLLAVVDDEEPVRKALTRLLRSAGLDVMSYPSGIEFIDSLPLGRPDCVVLDLHMPFMDGFEVLARLANSDTDIPVVTITGHHTNETRARALAGRPMAYLRKPLDDQLLLDAIEVAMIHKPPPQCTAKPI